MEIEIKILNTEFYTKGYMSQGNEDLQEYYVNMPKYATPGSAGIDLVCTEHTVIYPEETVMVGTGLAVWLGADCLFRGAGLVLPRSSLGHKKGLILGNTVGLIDDDYQGELKVSCYNRNRSGRLPRYKQKPITLRAGERFAQLVIVPVIKAQLNVVDEFSFNTERGSGGFGSTGV